MKKIAKHIFEIALFVFLVLNTIKAGGNELNSKLSSNKKALVGNHINYLSTVDLLVLEFIYNKYEFSKNESKLTSFSDQKRMFTAQFAKLQIQIDEIMINGKKNQNCFLTFTDKKSKNAYLKSPLAAKMASMFEFSINTQGNMIVYETPIISSEQLTNRYLDIVSDESFALYEESYKGGVMAYLDNFLGEKSDYNGNYLVDVVKEKNTK